MSQTDDKTVEEMAPSVPWKENSSETNEKDPVPPQEKATKDNKKRYCKTCRNHGGFNEVKIGHKAHCPRRACLCIACVYTKKERLKIAESTRVRRAQKIAEERRTLGLPVETETPSSSDVQISTPSPSSSRATEPNPNCAPNSPVGTSAITAYCPYTKKDGARSGKRRSKKLVKQQNLPVVVPVVKPSSSGVQRLASSSSPRSTHPNSNSTLNSIAWKVGPDQGLGELQCVSSVGVSRQQCMITAPDSTVAVDPCVVEDMYKKQYGFVLPVHPDFMPREAEEVREDRILKVGPLWMPHHHNLYSYFQSAHGELRTRGLWEDMRPDMFTSPWAIYYPQPTSSIPPQAYYPQSTLIPCMSRLPFEITKTGPTYLGHRSAHLPPLP